MGLADFSDDPDNIIYTDGSEPDKRIWYFKRSKTCCFTGHRPEKLPGGGEADFPGLEKMLDMAAVYARLLVCRGFDTFITGMSRGFDLMMAERLINSDFADSVNIVCAVPYPEQFREMRTAHEKEIYQRIIRQASLVAVSSPQYRTGCYAVRNQLMVNSSAALIGYISDRQSRSGSMQTVNMAQRARLEMYVMYGDENPQFFR